MVTPTPTMTNYEAYRKRKRNPKVYGFKTFADPGCPILLTGPFRENIRQFLGEVGEIESFTVNGMPTWCILLSHLSSNGVIVPLYIVEETVDQGSSTPFCDHCRCTGWSNHFVSKRRYHFVIPEDGEWGKALDDEAFDVHTHLLHGLIHCNGFGHLLAINGIEGGSKFLCGKEIMDLWDRICTALRARQVTVEDTSTKRSMDTRLLYGVAYGQSWFGRWGYRFCNGSFGVTLQNYESAIAVLSSLNLDEIVKDFADIRHSGRHIKQIVKAYRKISDTQLVTIRELVCFMLSIKGRPPDQMKSISEASVPPPKPPVKVVKKCQSDAKQEMAKYKKFSTFVSKMSSRWPAKRLQFAAEVIVDALKDQEGGMSRQEVRDAARLHIGDTGLLDYVIKSINTYRVGDYVVHRTVNAVTKVLQFTVQHIGEDTRNGEAEDEPASVISPSAVSDFPGLDVSHDIEYLYQHVLESYPGSELLELASQVVLDSKHFVKEWPFKDDDDDLLRFMCHILPIPRELETRLTRTLGPGVLLAVPPYATLGELKLVAEDAFRDTYCIMDTVIVREVEGANYMNDDEVVFSIFESGAQLWVRACRMDLDSKLKYEGGAENWTVNCSCGAKDDDGERMVACDMCEVWQHTRCIGIDETETMARLFLCSTCSASLMAPWTEYSVDLAYA